MKTNTLRAKLLNCFFAFTLVFGLCIPSIGSYAYAEPPAETPAGDVAAHVEGAQSGEDQTNNVGNNSTGDTGNTNNLGDGIQDETTTNTDTNANNSNNQETEVATTQAEEVVPMTADSTKGGLTISGGVAGTDFDHGDNLVVVKTSTPLTLKGTFKGSVQIQANTHAHLILNGVTITANNTSSPINLMTPSQAHITLVDGPTNTINANQNGCAAIHCGYGSTLYIDDQLVNFDSINDMANASHVGVENGVVSTAGFVTDAITGQKKEVNVGDVLTNVTSVKPGKLIAYGGGSSAAIGSGPNEIAGTMVFDGGDIWAYSCGGHSANPGSSTSGADSANNGVINATGVNKNYSSGTGIGAGGGASAGASEMEFNAATIHAYGSYHGAGIGAGWSGGADPSATQTGASTGGAKYKLNCGNITINGGYLLSQGYAHGNAFGGACGTNANGSTIKITGGTLLPYSYYSTEDKDNKKDIGGTGGHVVISGGSIRLSGPKALTPLQRQAVKFQSVDNNKAFSDDACSQEVVPITVNMVAETGETDYKITDWRLFIDGEKYVYGAPASFDKGQLYLWLPPSANSAVVSVELKYKNESTGQIVDVEPLYRDPHNASDTNVRRYVAFDLPTKLFVGAEYGEALLPDGMTLPGDLKVDGKVPEKVQTVKKQYDGLPLTTADISQPGNEIKFMEGNQERTLNDLTKIEYKFQVVDREKKLLGAEQSSGTVMPENAGLMAFSLTSTQYAVDAWGASYLGHRSRGWCEITPVDSSFVSLKAAWGNSDSNKSNAFDTLVVAADITSAEGTANTCKSPQGQIEIVVDGKVVETVDLDFNANTGNAKTVTTAAERDSIVQAEIDKYHGVINKQSVMPENALSALADEEQPKYDGYDGTREHTIFTHAIQVSKNDYLMPMPTDGNKHEITVNFKNSNNYNNSNGIEDNGLKEEVEVEQVTPGSNIGNPSGGEIEEKDPGDNPNPGPGGEDPGTSKELVKNYTMTGTYGAGSGDAKNEIAFTVKSPSYGKFIPKTSNGAVVDVKSIDLVKDDKGQPVKDANGNLSYKVTFLMNSAGVSDLVLEQEPSGAYAKSTFNIDTTIFPNPGEEPQIKVTVNEKNLGNPDDPDAKLAPEGMAAPGDVIEYTVTADNLTAGAAWQNAELSDVLSKDVTIDPDSIEVAVNYPTPSDEPNLDNEGNPIPTPEPTWVKPSDGSVKIINGKIVYKPGTSIYGDQSVSIRFKTKVNGDTADRNTDKNNPIKIENSADAQGTYGVNENPTTSASNPGVSKDIPEANITPGSAEPVTIIPDDVAEGKLVTTKTVENTSRKGGNALVHDVLKYTINATNDSPDSCLYDAFIIDKLPKGLIYKPGTLQLTDAEGNKSQVPDSAFNANLNALGFYVGDIYYGENVVATFEAEVGPEAATESIANIAQASGDQPTDKHDPKKEDDGDKDDPNKPGENPGDNPGGDDGDDPDGKKPTYPNNPVDPNDPDKKPHYPNNPTDPDNPDKKPSIPTDPGDINKNTGGVPDPDSSEDPKPNKPTDPTKPSVNVDVDGNGEPDVNVDTDGDGEPDINIVDEDGDGVPDFIDLKDPENPVDPNDPKTWPKPTTNIDDDYPDGDLVPDVNVDADGDGKPDVNIDTDGDGDPDVNIDADRDGIPDVNVDTDGDGKPDVNIDTDGDGKPDSKLDEDRNGVPDEDEKPKENKPGDSFWDPDNKDMTEDDFDEFIQSLPIKGENAEPAQPDSVLSADPDLTKRSVIMNAKNNTRSDGYTYVGDEVGYTVEIRNDSAPESAWLDVISRTDIPVGLDIVPGSIKLTTADGETVDVPDSAYDAKSRVLAFYVGDIPGGKQATVTFKSIVTLEALNQDIGMKSFAYGVLPSEFDATDENYVKPEPGEAFVPAEGWALYDLAHKRVESEVKVYPSEKTTQYNHVLPNTQEEVEQAKKLAKTGDTLGFVALGVGVVAVAAGAALVVARRRMKRNGR